MFYNLSQDWRWLSGFFRPSGCCFLRPTWACSTTRWPPSKSRPTTSSSIAQVSVITCWVKCNKHTTQISSEQSWVRSLLSSLFAVRTPLLRSPTSGRAPKRRLITPIPGQQLLRSFGLMFSILWKQIFDFPCPGISVVFWSRLQGRFWAPQCWGGGEGEPPAGGAGEAQSVRAPGVQGEAPHLQVLHPAAGHTSGRIRRVQRPQIPLLQRHASKLAAGPQRWPPPSPPHGHRDHPLRPLWRSLAALDCRARKVHVQKRTLQKQKG